MNEGSISQSIWITPKFSAALVATFADDQELLYLFHITKRVKKSHYLL